MSLLNKWLRNADKKNLILSTYWFSVFEGCGGCRWHSSGCLYEESWKIHWKTSGHDCVWCKSRDPDFETANIYVHLNIVLLSLELHHIYKLHFWNTTALMQLRNPRCNSKSCYKEWEKPTEKGQLSLEKKEV
jgi:hypothetical protein